MLIGFFALISAVACGSRTVSTPEIRTTPKAEEISGLVTKEWVIHRFEATFGPESDRGWVDVVRGIGPSLCERREGFKAMQKVLRYVEGEQPLISWEDVAVDPDSVHSEFQRAGIVLAKLLFNVLTLPHEDREMICGGGEDSTELADGGAVMRELVNTLIAVEADPSVIEATPLQLRELLLADYNKRIAHIRTMIERGEASESDGGGWLISVAREAVMQWNLTPYQLGLTDEETRAVRLSG